MKTLISTIVAGAAMFFATGASALVMTFTDRAAFTAAAGPVIVDSEAPNVSNFGLTAGPNASVAIGNFSSAMPGNELAFSGDENFDLLFNTSFFTDPIFSFGLDFIEPTLNSSQQINGNGCNVAVCVDSTFEFTLRSGGADLETLSFRPVDDAAQDEVVFFGFISDVAFDGLRVREVVGSNDNEIFQNFTVGATPLAPVPLPAPALLLLTGLAGLGFVGRRRKRSAA